MCYNTDMTPKITNEMRKALHQHPGKPLEVEDDQTQTVYVLVAKEDFREMVDQELRRQLQIGFDQADRGELEEWDVEEFLDRMHRRHEAKQA